MRHLPAALHKTADTLSRKFSDMSHGVLFIAAIGGDVFQVGMLATKRPSLSRPTTAQYQILYMLPSHFPQ